MLTAPMEDAMFWLVSLPFRLLFGIVFGLLALPFAIVLLPIALLLAFGWMLFRGARAATA